MSKQYITSNEGDDDNEIDDHFNPDPSSCRQWISSWLPRVIIPTLQFFVLYRLQYIILSFNQTSSHRTAAKKLSLKSQVCACSHVELLSSKQRLNWQKFQQYCCFGSANHLSSTTPSCILYVPTTLSRLMREPWIHSHSRRDEITVIILQIKQNNALHNLIAVPISNWMFRVSKAIAAFVSVKTGVFTHSESRDGNYLKWTPTPLLKERNIE